MIKSHLNIKEFFLLQGRFSRKKEKDFLPLWGRCPKDRGGFYESKSLQKHIYQFTIFLTIFLFYSEKALAQLPFYNMQNRTVYDCRGIFTDSNNGLPTGFYGHSENLTFTICVPGSTQIRMDFSSFDTESGFDVLRFFDGQDTLAPQIGSSYSGTLNPFSVVAVSGYLTIHFKTDASVNALGWQATWSTIVPPPIPPQIDTIIANCVSTQIQIQYNKNIHCDSVYLDAYSIPALAGSGIFIQNVVPVNCVNDSTNRVLLNLNSLLEDCGPFGIVHDFYASDICDSVYYFQLLRFFSVDNCPLQANILANDSVCLGTCISVLGEGKGGDCNYTYQWRNGFPNSAGPFNFCPTKDTLLRLIVRDNSMPQNIDSTDLWIRVFPVPDIGNDTIVCESASPFSFGATPLGGIWSGHGITDSLTGIYDPRMANVSRDTVYYFANGCLDSIFVTIIPINAGLDEIACRSNNPFLLQGMPSGGFWTGSKVSFVGSFLPDSLGNNLVVYNINGCRDEKIITVVDSLMLQPEDSICRSGGLYQLQFAPPGGTWSGPGIVDSDSGILNPRWIGTGWKTLTYTTSNCFSTLRVFIKQISIGGNIRSCPIQPPFNIPTPNPPGGVWSHTSRRYNSLLDSITGLLDPGANNGNNYTDTLIYTVDGCVDSVIYYVRTTNIGRDTLWFCVHDPSIALNWSNVRRTPSNGIWTGAGIIDPDWPGRFDPGVAGPGFHKLIYDANTCSDSMIMAVYAVPALRDTVICSNSNPFNLSAFPPGGIWNGNGITDTIQGTFDPIFAGGGSSKVYYNLLNGCSDSMTVTIANQQNASISGLFPYYCFKDTLLNPVLIPNNGNLTGAGIVGNQFNPKLAGPGQHYLYYQVGSGLCGAKDSILVEVGDSLEISVIPPTDTLCFGTGTRLSANVSGGIGSNYSFLWDNGLGFGQSHSILPNASTTYQVQVGDGCSETVSKSVYVHVYEEIIANVFQGPKVCFDSISYVGVNFPPGKNYTHSWLTSPPVSVDTLFGIGSIQRLRVIDNNSGCAILRTTEIPSYPFIGAKFSRNPNLICTSSLDSLTFIDLSIGGQTGYWLFGDGDSIPYQSGQNPFHFYPDSGFYNVKLYIENNGGCYSIYEEEICIKDEITVFIPTAFSPNDDGFNDEFKVFGSGLHALNYRIYDRWGNLIFEGNELDSTWDGKINGEYAKSGVYSIVLRYSGIGDPTRNYQKKGVLHLIR